MSERDAETRAPRRRSALRLALGLVISGALFALLARFVDFGDVRAVLAGADPWWLLAGLALYALLQAMRALRYRLLAPSASMHALLSVHAVHALLLRVMPMRSGELGFPWLMRRAGAGGFTESLVGVLLVRLLDLASVLSVFAAALVLASGTFQSDSAPSAALAVTVGALAALAPVYLRHVLVLAHRVLGELLSALRLDRLGRVQRAERALAAAIEDVRRLPGHVLWQVTGLTLVQWGINFTLFWVLLAAMGIEVSLAQAILGGTGSVLGGLLPLAGIGNFGPLEAGWALGFAAVGVRTDQAVASAFGFSVISFGYALLVGALGWVTLPRR